MEALPLTTGLSPRLVGDALNAAFSELRSHQMVRYAENEFMAGGDYPRKVMLIIAGNVFTAWLPAVYIALMAGSDLCLKPSVNEPVFAPLWKRSFDFLAPSWRNRVKVVSLKDDLLKSADAVVAYGADASLAALRKRCSPATNFIGYGHKISVAVIFREALDAPDLLNRIRADVDPFRLEGCLSPRILYVEESADQLSDGGAQKIARALSGIHPVPGIASFTNFAELLRLWQASGLPFSTLGYAGSSVRIELMDPQIRSLGFTRVCPLGEMQKPPLSWGNGGFSLARRLRVRI